MTRTVSSVSYLLTPPGAGAIGLIRVAGPAATELVGGCLRFAGEKSLHETKPGRLRYGHLLDDAEVVDEIVVCIAADCDTSSLVDITLHGGVRVLERAFAVLERRGAPLARNPATVWPTASLVQTEALEALQRARTRRAAMFLAEQRLRLHNWLNLLSQESCADLRTALAVLLRSAHPGIALARGASVAIVGPPNSGKSTLFNRLVGRPAALVSAIAGTTRDWVSHDVELDGVPIRLIDTAGIHETTDQLEELAIRGGAYATADCDLYLVVVDATSPAAALRSVQANERQVVVMNKVDRLEARNRAADSTGTGPVYVSASTGHGVDNLVAVILNRLGFVDGLETQPCLFTQRQVSVCSDILSASDRQAPQAREWVRTRLLQPLDSGGVTGLE